MIKNGELIASQPTTSHVREYAQNRLKTLPHAFFELDKPMPFEVQVSKEILKIKSLVLRQ